MYYLVIHHKKVSGFTVTEQRGTTEEHTAFLSLALLLDAMFCVTTSWKLFSQRKEQPCSNERAGDGLIIGSLVYFLFLYWWSACGVLSWKAEKKKRPGLTLARSPPAVKGKSHPGWGQSLTVTQTDSLACVSRSSATITAAQTWALLLQLTAWRLDRLLHVGKAERTLVGWTQVGVSEWTLWALPVQGYKRRRGHILNVAGLGMYGKAWEAASLFS